MKVAWRNMAFTPGTWNQLPSNCSRSYPLTFQRCAAYGTVSIQSCVSWATNATTSCIAWATQAIQTCVSWGSQASQSCAQWGQQTSSECCDWAPCSWFCDAIVTITSWVCIVVVTVVTVVCVVFAVVVIVVCALFLVIVTIVCAIWTLLVYIFCLIWSLISIIFCISNADGGTAFLLTDGTVMMQERSSAFGQSLSVRRWWKLTPDGSGSYLNGSWSRLADSNQDRLYFASGVLADGRVLVCGGEYSDASGSYSQDDTNTCEIYDPVADSWAVLSAPPSSANPATTWTQIGDSPSTVLPDGTFLMASFATTDVAKFDPATNTWAALSARPPAISTASEESFVLMPDQTIASVSCVNPTQTIVYDIATDSWSSSNALPTDITGPIPGAVNEIGPGLLRYDRTAFFVGGNQNTAVYSPSARVQWTNGPPIPSPDGGQTQLGTIDGPGAILPNGNVLVGAGPLSNPGNFNSPDSFFEYDGGAFNPTSAPPNNNCPTYVTRLLLLPNGDVLFAREDDSSFFAYRPADSSPQEALRPVILTCPETFAPGATIQVSGTQFNGLSQGTAYGDDSQAATNYPLVRLNGENGGVTYCRTSNHRITDPDGTSVTSMGVATGALPVTTDVAVPSGIAPGNYNLEVVANGIASEPFAVSVR
jgi:hypothetical protein